MANRDTSNQLSWSDCFTRQKSGSGTETKAAVDARGKATYDARMKEVNERRRKAHQAQEEAKEHARRQQEAHITEVTCMELPMDWENVFSTDDRAQGVHADSIADGLILSLGTLGRVDIEYISAVTGADCKTVICTLKGSIYQNPLTWEECFYKGWETAEEYLSGNLMRKLQAARDANAIYNGYFDDNVTALLGVLPPALSTEDIYITLGSPWVPADIIDEFILYLFGHRTVYYNVEATDECFHTLHDELTGTWEIPYKTRYQNSIKSIQTYGTAKINALHILERTLNMKAVSVTKEIPCPTNVSGSKRIIDQEETLLAVEKQKKLIAAFRKWVWKDEERTKRLIEIFQSNFGCVRRRIFDGSFLTFPTMSPEIRLYPYQKNAVARMLFTPNTLLAHDVGAGKTYEMIAAAMEARRMGLSKKAMFVVPNNLVGQWKTIFTAMYPQAELLCVDPKSFTSAKRSAMLERMRDENPDGIIIAYSCFEQIPLSREFYRRQLLDEQAQIEALSKKVGKGTAKLSKKMDAVKKALFELETALEESYNGVYFDELGIARLFVDEAHNFKNVPLETKTSRTLGINAGGSKKCRDMLDKVRMVQKQNDGGGVVLATGTPITNSITDAFIMQKYLQNGELALLDLQSFDSWVGMFAERRTEFEIDVDTSTYRLTTRFSKFHNLPELTALLSSIADFHQVDTSAGIPVTDGHQDALISKTADFAAYLQQISQRAEDVRAGLVSRKDDNMLKITTDGRKAALDLRLVDPLAPFTFQSKVARLVENVVEIYRKTTPQKSTQLIFCDTSTPKAGFNLYDEIRMLLLESGIPFRQIAFIHDADTEPRRNALFSKVRSGEVRILLGSTFRLGLGVNVQDRLIALHHLDVPWRPADMTQREGRILRQGNQNPKVQIFRYITEGSFDAYSWQLLETKQRFISELLSGSLTQRSGSDIEDTVLNYGEVKALAVGDPLVKKRVETANELSRLMALQRTLVQTRLKLQQELTELPGRKDHQELLIGKCREDIKYLSRQPETSGDKKTIAEQRRILRTQIYEAVSGNILETKERVLFPYRGFDIILPAGMTKEKPYIFLKRHGKYYLELGDAEVGMLIRIDNFLQNLPAHLDKLEAELSKLEQREVQIREELGKEESYTDKIEAYRKKLAALDKKLGVDKL